MTGDGAWSIRPMSPNDVAAVAPMRWAAFFEGTERTVEIDAAGLVELLRSARREAAFVAEVDGRPVGTCLLIAQEIDQLHDLTPWLAGLVVDAGHRSRGIGAALVNAVETHARELGFAQLYLYADDAEGFYGRLGWETLDVVPGDEARTVLMRRRLVVR